MTDLTVAQLDRDGALRDAFAGLHGQTRAEFLGRAAVGCGALVLAAVAAPPAASAASTDRAILNFFLGFEHLQAAFYGEVERLGALTGELAEQARVVGAHERAHAGALRDLIGAGAVRAGRYDFRGATEDAARFRRTAVAFEDLTVAAIQGQAPRIASKATLAAVAGVHTVEARHAAWIRRLAGVTPAGHAFDGPLPAARVAQIVDRTRFTVGAARTRSRRAPRFTG
jgi:Ferritin-like domain